MSMLRRISFSRLTKRQKDVREPPNITEMLHVNGLQVIQFTEDNNKRAWETLFAEDAIIEDPFGSPAHVNLSEYFDTFIAPYQLKFTKFDEWIDPVRLRVYYNVDLKTAPQNGPPFTQPMHMELTFNDDLRITTIKYFWSLWHSSVELGNPIVDRLYFWGRTGWQAYHLLSKLGYRTGSSYMANLMSVYFSEDITWAQTFENAVNRDNRILLEGLFTSQAIIELPNGENVSVNAFYDRIRQLKIKHVRLNVSYYCGNVMSSRLTLSIGRSGYIAALAIFYGNRKMTKVKQLTFLW